MLSDETIFFSFSFLFVIFSIADVVGVFLHFDNVQTWSLLFMIMCFVPICFFGGKIYNEKRKSECLISKKKMINILKINFLSEEFNSNGLDFVRGYNSSISDIIEILQNMKNERV